RSGTGMGVLGPGCAAVFNSGLRPAEAKAGPGSGVWSQGYVADKGDVRLAMYRKWLPPSPDNRLPVLFLVHGSSLSARSTFDLDVPGADYSIMDVVAAAGFDAWT